MKPVVDGVLAGVFEFLKESFFGFFGRKKVVVPVSVFIVAIFLKHLLFFSKVIKKLPLSEINCSKKSWLVKIWCAGTDVAPHEIMWLWQIVATFEEIAPAGHSAQLSDVMKGEDLKRNDQAKLPAD
ncbi:hypothetical protein D3C86_1414840 [compost metagenome]